jgi:putative DNA primase/helicase
MQTRQHSIPNDIARLKGRRFIVIPETDENEMLNASLIKALSAGDQLTARFLFGEFFDFFFAGKLWIATNHKPKIFDNSKGFWDRIKVVPFTVDIPSEQLIKSDDLLGQLLAEGDGILAWAVQGARDYFEIDGLDTPPAITAEIERYRREQDSILQFIEECCETAEDLRKLFPDEHIPDEIIVTQNGDLYNAYKKFCYENGEHPKSHRRLSLKLHEKGFKQIRANSGPRSWIGIRLKMGT